MLISRTEDFANIFLNKRLDNKICYRVSRDFPEGKQLQNDGYAN
jgi:hypothetical protein